MTNSHMGLSKAVPPKLVGFSMNTGHELGLLVGTTICGQTLMPNSQYENIGLSLASPKGSERVEQRRFAQHDVRHPCCTRGVSPGYGSKPPLVFHHHVSQRLLSVFYPLKIGLNRGAPQPRVTSGGFWILQYITGNKHLKRQAILLTVSCAPFGLNYHWTMV